MTEQQRNDGIFVDLNKRIFTVTAMVVAILVIGLLVWRAMSISAVVLWIIGGLGALSFGGQATRGVLAVRRSWKDDRRFDHAADAELLLLRADVSIRQEEARRHKAVADGAEISKLIVETRAAVIIFDTHVPYTVIPVTVSERKALAAANEPEVLPAPRPDLMTVFTQPGGVYSITGPQRSGKTWQAGRIADHWLSFGIPPIVICSKVDNPGHEWIGCNLIVSEDTDTLAAALGDISKRMSDRYKKLAVDRSPMPLFLDDWMATMILSRVAAFGFMADAATRLASAGIIPYFIMQSDTAGAYGVKEFGAMLKNNFTRLNVIPLPAPNGVIEPGNSRGELFYPNNRRGVDIDLLTGRPNCFPKPINALESVPAAPPERTDEERIRDMIADRLSNYAICKTLGWSMGGSKYARIDTIRAETSGK